ncbi:MAG: aminopeptidase [Spirochaetales bacterium]|nr:aminopeptidase [Spirochaetales bacterium]
MKNLINSYIDFISDNKTERLCVQAGIRLAEKNGYKDINSTDRLKAGDKVYVNKMDKSLILFEIGSGDISCGMNILGAHIDSPRLDAKQNPFYEDRLYKTGIVYLNTHYYGGIKKYQWVATPLAIYGVVYRADGTKVDIAIGDDPKDPVFCISDILPHIAQEQMKKPASDFIEGEKLDAVLACYPNVKNYKDPEKDKYTAGDGKKKVLKLIEDKYGITEEDFASAELELVPAGRARYLGFDKTLVLGYGQDDRVCAYTSLVAMVEGKAGKRTNCCILADKEEVGSNGATGMNSHLLDNALAEVVARLEVTGNPELAIRRALASSYMLSSDVNSAFDPLNAGLYDIYNSSFLGRGVVFNKYTGARGKSGASDANPEFIAKVRGVLYANEVYFQNAELSKVDTGGGGTIAHYAAEHGMNVLDCGVSVLSMHAPWEITSAFDIEQAYKCYKAFIELA